MKEMKTFLISIPFIFVAIILINVFILFVLDLDPSPVRGRIIGSFVGVTTFIIIYLCLNKKDT